MNWPCLADSSCRATDSDSRFPAKVNESRAIEKDEERDRERESAKWEGRTAKQRKNKLKQNDEDAEEEKQWRKKEKWQTSTKLYSILDGGEKG